MNCKLLVGPARGTRSLDPFTVLDGCIVDQHVQLHTPDYRRDSSNEAACAAGMPTRTPAAWASALQALMIPSR